MKKKILEEIIAVNVLGDSKNGHLMKDTKAKLKQTKIRNTVRIEAGAWRILKTKDGSLVLAWPV